METLETIKTRRSIRKFRTKSLSEEQINVLLEAAMYAPSARNTQSWHFIVIDDRDVLNKIPKIHPYADMLYEAPLAILICGDLHIEAIPEYNALNCAAATQNIMLAAHSIGLGSVWLGVYPRIERMEPLIKLMELSENVIPISLLAIGYPNEEVPQPVRFKKERIRKNKW